MIALCVRDSVCCVHGCMFASNAVHACMHVFIHMCMQVYIMHGYMYGVCIPCVCMRLTKLW